VDQPEVDEQGAAPPTDRAARSRFGPLGVACLAALAVFVFFWAVPGARLWDPLRVGTRHDITITKDATCQNVPDVHLDGQMFYADDIADEGWQALAPGPYRAELEIVDDTHAVVTVSSGRARHGYHWRRGPNQFSDLQCSIR